MKKTFLLFLVLVFSFALSSCTIFESSRQPSPAFETLSEVSPTTDLPSMPGTPTATSTHQIPTREPTATATDIPDTRIGEYFSSLDAQDDQVQFLAYQNNCDIPAVFDLADRDPDCTAEGIVTEDSILFPDIAGFQLLRVVYEMGEEVLTPVFFIENTLIKVFEIQEEFVYESSDPLLETSLLWDEGHPDFLFADIELAALQEVELTAFHVVVFGLNDQIYRVDQVDFDDNALEVFIVSRENDQDSKDQRKPTTLPVLPTATNTAPPPADSQPVLPTQTQLPSQTATAQPTLTATQVLPTETQPPLPTNTLPPRPTSTPISTMPPRPTPTPCPST